MVGRKKRAFPAEFKVEAVRQIIEGGRSVAQVGRELGIRADVLARWRRQAEGRAGLTATDIFPGNGQQPSEAADNRRLRRELEAARQEIEFLKKAALYFAKESR
jgi:transposase